MFGNNDDGEPNQKQKQQGSNKSIERRGRAFNNKDVPSTPDSDNSNNSGSEVSNEDPPKSQGCLGGKYKSEPDVQSSGGDHAQTFSKGELQQALAGLDSSLDPKRAKRLVPLQPPPPETSEEICHNNEVSHLLHKY